MFVDKGSGSGGPKKTGSGSATQHWYLYSSLRTELYSIYSEEETEESARFARVSKFVISITIC